MDGPFKKEPGELNQTRFRRSSTATRLRTFNKKFLNQNFKCSSDNSDIYFILYSI